MSLDERTASTPTSRADVRAKRNADQRLRDTANTRLGRKIVGHLEQYGPLLPEDTRQALESASRKLERHQEGT